MVLMYEGMDACMCVHIYIYLSDMFMCGVELEVVCLI